PYPCAASRRALAALAAEGNRGVRRIPGKHGGATDAFATVVVLVPDRPGELARLLTEIGQIGVNLEDLRLEHELGRAVGLAHIAIDAAREDLLTRALTERRWRVADARAPRSLAGCTPARRTIPPTSRPPARPRASPSRSTARQVPGSRPSRGSSRKRSTAASSTPARCTGPWPGGAWTRGSTSPTVTRWPAPPRRSTSTSAPTRPARPSSWRAPTSPPRSAPSTSPSGSARSPPTPSCA